MSGTAEDEEALERRNRNRLAADAAVVVICILGIMVVYLVRRFLHSMVRSHVDEP